MNEAEIRDLVQQMSLEQKIGQMTQPERMHISPEEVRDAHIGSVLSGGGSTPGENRPEDWVDMNDAYWAASVEEGPGLLPIPILYGVDAVHGHNNVQGATMFPHNIGLGAANDPELIRRIAAATAREILATGVEWTFAPTLAVARNDHWGRTYESYSEDPEIVSRYASAFVEGIQGDLGDDSVIACAKHFVGDGGTTRGVDQGETTVSEEELRRLHLAPYFPALDSGVLTVMASYNSWNQEKCHGHRHLLTDILKGEMGFQGFVVSDWDGIDQLDTDYGTAAKMSINAGVDMFMVPGKWRDFIGTVTWLVNTNQVSMERIDDAVTRILRVKAAYGLFHRPRPADRKWSGSDIFGSAEHRDVAREAVRKSLVLLKNEDQALPLKRESKLLVAGKSAHNIGFQCGGFTVAWQGTHGNDGVHGGTSIWQGIEARSDNAVLSEDGSAADEGDFDLAVVVIGERPYAEGLGDVREGGVVNAGSSVELVTAVNPPPGVLHPYGRTLEHFVSHPEDIAVMERIAAAGIPMVMVLVSGRPLVVNREMDLSKAVVAAWLPGTEGDGVSEVLFGEHDFQGRLSFSWPRSNSENPNRGDDPDVSCYPYGHGLSLWS